ncbi:hypothetical protein [Bradyrhizobium sp. USDA 329]|uniref:hypothetical protein n=1 Tax=unclassified Bradyrhizobium TaxID=2631580 RepID=UPI0035121531
MPSPLTEYSPEWETFEAEASELADSDRREIIDESTELDLASELLAVSNELELDQFLGDLIRKVGRAAGSIVHSPLGKAIGSRLKSVIKTALPLAGGALGTFAGGPLGASIGSGLASMAGRAFGLELEGLGPEDRELAAAKRFVRFASEAVGDAIGAPRSQEPATTARLAIAAAARRNAPGLWRYTIPRGRKRRRQSQRDRSGGPIHIRSAEDSMHNIGRIQLETDPELENYEAGQLEWPGETVFNEAEEMELAAQLMEVNSEEELDQFLGDLIRKAGRALGSFVSSPSGQAIGGILKGAVRQILPHAAGALGTFVGGPLGAQIGTGLAAMAGNEMEAESFEQEDREFAGARQFVRVGADAVRNTVAAGPHVEAMEAAQAGIAQAANALAPALLRPPAPDLGPCRCGQRGRWRRRGNKIVLYGV